MSEEHHFNPQKIFVTLFVLTALEVLWGKLMPYDQKALALILQPETRYRDINIPRQSDTFETLAHLTR